MSQQVYFVGSPSEVTHHMRPFAQRLGVKQIAAEDVIQQAAPGDLAIFFSEHFDRFRQAIIELKARDVATLYLVDGILEWRNAWLNRDDEPACPWTMRPVLAHKVACIGYQQARILSSWGNGAKVEIVGIPRLDQLPETEFRDNGSRPWKLLVITAKCPGFTPAQQETTLRSLQSLQSFFQEPSQPLSREVSVRWRLTADLAEKLGVINETRDLSGGELADQIREVDAVVTTPSTAMLEAMLLGKPTALLDFHGVPQWSPAVWNLAHESQFRAVFEQMMAPTALAEMWQRELLHDQLYRLEPATDRLAQLIEQMLQQAAAKLAKSEPLEFPAQMLRAPLTESLRFDHSALFPKFSEFRNADVLELQSQLAHSRREIKYLQTRMAQLQSELDAAHRIFEQIHHHPVAGPIVRARQWFLDWMQRWSAKGSAAPAGTPEASKPVD
jgi:hypothetical protein